jgi:hypothetical protein
MMLPDSAFGIDEIVGRPGIVIEGIPAPASVLDKQTQPNASRITRAHIPMIMAPKPTMRGEKKTEAPTIPSPHSCPLLHAVGEKEILPT